MTEAQAIEIISEQLNGQWVAATGLPLTQLALENEALPTADTFGQLTVRHSVSQQITYGPPGGRRFERRGTVYVKLWVPADGGRKAFSTLADAVRGIFEGQQLGGSPGVEPVTLYGGLTREVGNDGRWFIGAIQFPFVYYATV